MSDRNEIFKSVLEADRAAVVICDLSHTVIYMNPAAIRRYARWGGKDLLGKSLMDCHNEKSRAMIEKVLEWFQRSESNNLVYTSYNPEENKDVYMVALRNEEGDLIGYYEKHEYRNRESMQRYDLKNVKLIKLTKEYEKPLIEMWEEWKADIETNHTNGSPWVIFKNDPHDFDHYLEQLETKEETEQLVPDSVFFLLDEDRQRLLGAVNIRHKLKNALLTEGGHIGDGIRPSERRKGYATQLIRLALEECRKLGIGKVLIVCDKDNTGSARSIQKNGGVLENEMISSEGTLIQRYWIDLSE